MRHTIIFQYPRRLSQRIRNKSPVKEVRIPEGIRVFPKNLTNRSFPRFYRAQQYTFSNPAKTTADKDKEKLERLVRSSQKTLFTVSAVFPFDPFPDQISIEPLQVNISKKSFFFTYHMQTIPLRNVADVFLQTSLLFASIKIIDLNYGLENSVRVDYLPKGKACRARRIIQGLVIALKEGIDLSHLPPHELVLKAEQLGDARDIDLID